MELTDYLAILGLIAGGAYIVLAVIAFGRSRRRPADEEIERGRVVLNFEENELLEGEPTDDRMHKLAAICASLGKRVFAEDFDFTVESIARLERAIMIGWGESDEEINPQVLFSFGAYVGEV